jgi:hypothetical protein
VTDGRRSCHGRAHVEQRRGKSGYPGKQQHLCRSADPYERRTAHLGLPDLSQLSPSGTQRPVFKPPLHAENLGISRPEIGNAGRSLEGPSLTLKPTLAVSRSRSATGSGSRVAVATCASAVRRRIEKESTGDVRWREAQEASSESGRCRAAYDRAEGDSVTRAKLENPG